MIVRAEDFANKQIFMCLVEEAQAAGKIPKGPLSFDEGDNVVDLDALELEVRVSSAVDTMMETQQIPRP
ncbi:MAG: hypothetical protein PHF86_04915 [Candidatus Nanoarchaeia archaeon]|jgi:hypothetical protein|nr:hypothetical protein [Candidatus Nanoarchaeia archaeon]